MTGEFATSVRAKMKELRASGDASSRTTMRKAALEAAKAGLSSDLTTRQSAKMNRARLTTQRDTKPDGGPTKEPLIGKRQFPAPPDSKEAKVALRRDKRDLPYVNRFQRPGRPGPPEGGVTRYKEGETRSKHGLF